MQSASVACFKAYDIRGEVPSQLNEEIAYRIGRAYASFLKPKRVIVGYDIRKSSEALSAALTKGLTEGGSDVYDIGLCGTEEVYFATFHEKMDGGIMVTASHNPANYNGMKLVRESSKPVSGDTGLREIESLVANASFEKSDKVGSVHALDMKSAYVDHILSYVDTSVLKPLKVVVNAGNGCAGPVLDLIENRLPFEFIKVNNNPDGNFPNGIPNPLLHENRGATESAVKEHNADVGIAWDGDFDRCFFFDERGSFVEGYYIVGILAESALKHNPGASIIYDPRLRWNTVEIVESLGGVPVQCKTGHAFIKERMRKEDAVYGGEMSAHHYFKDFSYCDSGMITCLLMLEAICKSGNKLSEMLCERMRMFPASGEINRKLKNPDKAIEAIEETYKGKALLVDYTDGLSIEFPTWRFNIRKSNTEPILRLNVESRSDVSLMEEKTKELLGHIALFP